MHSYSVMKLYLFLSFALCAASCCSADDTLTSIGVIAPLTGNQAQIGEAIKNGLLLAEKDRPELFKSVKIILEDSQFNNRMAVTAFKKLTELDRVQLIYVFGHGQSHILAPLAQTAEVALVACTGEKDIEADRNYVIRFFVPHEWLGYILLKHLTSNGYHRFGIIKSELSFIENIFRGLNSNLGPEDSLEIIEIHTANDSDFRTSIAKAKRKKFDALGVFLGQGQIAPFYQQLNQLDHVVPTFGTHAFESSEEIKQAGSTIDGAILPAIAASPDFRVRYREEFGHETFVAFAANGYDFATLGARLVAVNKTAPKLVAAFRNTKNELGASGAFEYRVDDKFGSGFLFPVAMIKILDGKLVELTRYSL